MIVFVMLHVYSEMNLYIKLFYKQMLLFTFVCIIRVDKCRLTEMECQVLVFSVIYV